MKERTILHSDVNNFFASVECATRADLKNKPVAVAGNPVKRTGIILAKNEIAKHRGVKTGQAIWEARLACPDLVTLLPHYDLYEEISEKLHELYLQYTDFVEPLGMDECWLDVTDSLKYLHKTGTEIADEIRARVQKEFGFTVSVGVSFSKIFAKLGSDLKKPNATTVIDRPHFQDIVYPLPLASIVGIGRRLEKKFNQMNVHTIREFINLPDTFLTEVMGITGTQLKAELLGERMPAVLNYYELPPPKSIGNGTTTLKDIKTREELKATVFFLSEKVSVRLIQHHLYATTLAVSVKINTMQKFRKSHKIESTHSAKKIGEEALRLLDMFWKYDLPVRAIRVRTSDFIPDNARQMSMFEDAKDEAISLLHTQDKYGKIGLLSDKKKFINNAKNPHE